VGGEAGGDQLATAVRDGRIRARLPTGAGAAATPLSAGGKMEIELRAKPRHGDLNSATFASMQ